MPKVLTIDEMLEALECCAPDTAAGFTRQVEQLASEIGRSLAVIVDVDCGEGSTQHGFGGTCVNFYPKTPNQPVPECLEQLDEGGDWETKSDFDRTMLQVVERLRD